MSTVLAELRHELDERPSAPSFEAWFAQACAEGRAPDRLRDQQGLTTEEYFRVKALEGADHTYWTGPDSIPLDAGGRQKIERWVMERHLNRTLNLYNELVIHRCDVANCIRPRHLEVVRRERFDRTELIARLRNAARILGRTPLTSDAGTHGVPYSTSLCRAFGSRVAALNAAGLEVPDSKRFAQCWTENEIVGALQDYHARTGLVPRYGEWEDAHRVPSAATIRRRFGSFRAGLSAAGFES